MGIWERITPGLHSEREKIREVCLSALQQETENQSMSTLSPLYKMMVYTVESWHSFWSWMQQVHPGMVSCQINSGRNSTVQVRVIVRV